MKHIIILKIVLSSLFFSSCSHNFIEQPPSKVNKVRSPASVNDLITDIPQLLIQADKDFTQDNCTRFLGYYINQIYNRPSGFFYPKNKKEEQKLNENFEHVVKNLFELRLLIQSKFKNFSNPSAKCVALVQSSLRMARFTEESLLDWKYENKYKKWPKTAAFQQGWPSTMTLDGVQFEFQTGDVILMRGQTFISATIARIGDEDSQFSHLGIVGEDNKGEKYVVETLIETGTRLEKLSSYLKKPETRLVIYRYKNPEIAKKAGQFAYREVNKLLNKKSYIPYDFKMDLENQDELFCSELIKWAFQSVNSEMNLPKYKTSYSRLLNSSFMKGLGIEAKYTFAPSDIELEPDFDFIAEYRHLPSTRKSLVQDAMFSSVFHWSETKNYELVSEPTSWTASKLAKGIRSIGLFKSKMQPHMHADTLKTVIRMSYLSKPIEEYIFKLDDEYKKKNGFAMTYKDILKEMEIFRSSDCQKYLITKKDFSYSEEKSSSKFHWIYSPKSSQCPLQIEQKIFIFDDPLITSN